MTHPSPRDRRFSEYLRGLALREDGDARAALAALRRGLGKEPGEVAEVAQQVMPWIGEHDRDGVIAAYFQVAALFAGHRISWPSSDGGRLTNLGASFRRLAGPPGGPDEPGPERRLVALLNAHPDEVDRHLRHAVSLLKSKEIGIDWAQLLRDVQEWGYEDRGVQKAWARAFWGSGRTVDADAAPEPTEVTPVTTDAPTPA